MLRQFRWGDRIMVAVKDEQRHLKIGTQIAGVQSV